MRKRDESRLTGHDYLMGAMIIHCDGVVDNIVAFLRKKVTDGRYDGICLGVSGGIDSAVTAAVAVRAMEDSSKVYGLHLFDRDSQIKFRHHAQRLAKQLNISLELRDIAPLVKEKGIYNIPMTRLLRISSSLNRVIYSLLNLIRSRTRTESVVSVDRIERRSKLRVRVTSLLKSLLSLERVFSGFAVRHILRREILEAYAEDNNLLLVGAANRTEYFLGWFVTGGVDDLPIEPLLGLYKNQVVQLADFLHVPDEILEEAPSPDMMKGMTDEDIMGFDYDTLDKVAYVVEHGLNREDAVSSGVHPDEYEKILAMNRRSEHRREKHEFPVIDPRHA